MKRLHRALKHWRGLRDLTQKEVAEQWAVSRPYVAAIERGYVPPLALIGVPATELILDETGETAPSPSGGLPALPAAVPVNAAPGPGPGPDPDFPAYTPVRQILTTRRAVERADRVLAGAGFSRDQVALNLLEFLCRREAAYLRVTSEEVSILATLRFKKGDPGEPEPEDYLDFLVTPLRPFIPKQP